MTDKGKDDMDAKQIQHLDILVNRLESGIAEYIKLSQRTSKILWISFISGIAKGLGFFIGGTIVVAIVYKIVSHIISMNIPYLTELLRQAIEVVNSTKI